MSTNYRSRAPLIAMFNKWFASLFVDEKFRVEGLEYTPQTFSDNSNGSHNKEEHTPLLMSVLSSQEQTLVAKNTISSDVLCLCDFIHIPKELKILADEQRTLEAYNIAQRIKTMIDNKIAPEDIAVLASRKRSFHL